MANGETIRGDERKNVAINGAIHDRLQDHKRPDDSFADVIDRAIDALEGDTVPVADIEDALEQLGGVVE
jgi:predicted CopG family antitoxin